MSDVFGEETGKQLAVDMSAKGAIAVIEEEIESPAALAEFMEGEGRKTVMAAAVAKFGDANAFADPSAGLMEVDLEDQPDPQVDEVVDEETYIEDEKMYLIEIDEVEGRPNFEVVGVNGKVFRIQRGVPAKVPGSVLEVLNNAVAERIVQTHNPQGGVTTRRQKYSTVPFRVLKAF